jgi:hypothetical protein
MTLREAVFVALLALYGASVAVVGVIIVADVVRAVAHVVAYRTACACGWRGPSRATVQRARNDYTLHEHEHAHAKAGA